VVDHQDSHRRLSARAGRIEQVAAIAPAALTAAR
jgi:hypothetical protein